MGDYDADEPLSNYISGRDGLDIPIVILLVRDFGNVTNAGERNRKKRVWRATPQRTSNRGGNNREDVELGPKKTRVLEKLDLALRQT